MRRSYNPKSNSFYSDSEQSDDDEQDFRRNKYANAPRFVKNDINKMNADTIIVNVSKTQYQIIQEVAEELGWIVETSKKSQKWDIMWIDSHIEAYDLFKLNDHQKISHFPSIYVLTRKNFLGRSLMKMNKFYPDKYNFFPFTWSIPADYTDLLRYDQKIEKDSCEPQYYIYKPESMAQGKGIKICNKTQSLKNKTGIVQIYVNNPFLIQNLKFDLRIYVLILGYDPLRIFIYDEGLGRFATQKYQPAGKKNMKDVYMHLTNYAINKNNRNFIFNTSDRDMDKGHKRSLTAIYKYLSSHGIDISLLKQRIDEMIIKTLIVGQPMIAHTYGLAQSDNNYNDLCFQILGFDVLIDQNLQPILLEVNHTPSFKTETPLDKSIKKNLIKDTFALLNINLENKRQKLEQKKQFIELRSQRKLTKLTAQEKQAIRNKKWKQREEYQQKNLGNYRKIFPLKDSLKKYEGMIECANKIFNEHNGFKNKQKSKGFSNTSRPKSFGKIKHQRFPILSPIKQKISSGIYSKTTEIAEEEQKLIGNKLKSKIFARKEDQTSCKFPEIDSVILRQEKSQIYDYMQNIKSKPHNHFFKQPKSQSLSPVRKKPKMLKSRVDSVGLLEQQLMNKGSFVAPKLLVLNEINSWKDSQNNLNSSDNIQERQQYPKSAVILHKSGTKVRKFEEVQLETSTALSKFSPVKLCTYQNLINSLSQANQMSKIGSISMNFRKERNTKKLDVLNNCKIPLKQHQIK